MELEEGSEGGGQLSFSFSRRSLAFYGADNRSNRLPKIHFVSFSELSTLL